MTENIEVARDHLIYLNNRVQRGFKVQRFIDFPCPWIKMNAADFDDYVKTYGFPNHREILKYEIVIDIDAEDTASGKTHADLLEKRLRKNKMFFSRWKSGGDGEHFHMIFKIKDLNDLYSTFTENLIRPELIKLICGKRLLRPKKIESHICLFNKKLIQIEYMKHRKGGYKELISKKAGINKIPKKFVTLLEDITNKRKAVAKKIEELKRSNTYPEMNCITFFEGKDVNKKNIHVIQDGYYRAMFSLASHYKRQGNSADEIIKKLLDWYKTIPEEWIATHKSIVNKSKIRYTARNALGSAGCPFNRLTLEDTQALNVCKGCSYDIDM